MTRKGKGSDSSSCPGLTLTLLVPSILLVITADTWQRSEQWAQQQPVTTLQHNTQCRGRVLTLLLKLDYPYQITIH